MSAIDTPTTAIENESVDPPEALAEDLGREAAEAAEAAEAPQVAPAKPKATRKPKEAPAEPKVTRKPTAAQKAKADKAASQTKRIAPTMREIEVDGQTVRVAIGLSDADAVKYAKRLLAKGTADVEPDTKPVVAKAAKTPKGTQQSKKVEPGHVRVRFTWATYEQALAGKDGAAFRKANPTIAKLLKDLPRKTAGGAGYAVYFAVLPISDVAIIAKHLTEVAAVWAKAEKGKAPGKPATLLSNVERMKLDAKSAK